MSGPTPSSLPMLLLLEALVPDTAMTQPCKEGHGMWPLSSGTSLWLSVVELVAHTSHGVFVLCMHSIIQSA